MGEAANIFDRTLTADANTRDLHRVGDETLEDCATYMTHLVTWEGDYNDCKSTFDKYYTNKLVTGDDEWISSGETSLGIDKVVVGRSLRQYPGGRGRASFTIKGYKRVYEGGLDFERVDKDIRAWRSMCSDNKPDIGIIVMWEQTKDTGRADLYGEFKYLNGSGDEQDIPEGPTKKLAEMMYRGVESFPEYAPTLAITITFARHPCDLITDGSFLVGALLGKVVSASDILPQGWNIPIGGISASPSPVRDFESVMPEAKILCTADKLQCNADGSYTLTRAFSKYKTIESELYVGAGGEFGPYDSNS